MFKENAANEITIKDIENFLDGDWESTADSNMEEGSPATQPDNDSGSTTDTDGDVNVTETQAFSRRLRKATDKARNEERESIAKSLGYESYADMQSKREAEILRQQGFDPEEVAPVVDELVKKRIAENPLLEELADYRQSKVNAWAKQELAELKELTDGKISKLSDVPKDVLELWKTKGSLKAAYLELNGEQIIREMRLGITSEQNRGTTDHMRSPQGQPARPESANKRPFTQQEREIYKLFNPGVTDEQLSKMYKET